ncbi:hypothetical protein L0657_22755 [Dyadobacter sp. CY345]|uniref:hypothetical protein n=1 Tax=Dyadobacter sp. CY345 TaxID=2909335 RepID=UPI001F45F63D|nr:hypothetical protein [Dyadobacter sp. CY345]MCF2446794.1 hypothetical protein [Dyadobacter sp. CY345]
MKQSQTSNPKPQVKVENKDNLDSRHKEEDMVKKDHITNNQKEHHSENKSQSQKQSK